MIKQKEIVKKPGVKLMKKLEPPFKMNLLNIIKNKLRVFFRIFSSKSKIDAKSARNEARKLMQIKPTKRVKVKSIYFPPKIQLVKKISLGKSQLYVECSHSQTMFLGHQFWTTEYGSSIQCHLL